MKLTLAFSSVVLLVAMLIIAALWVRANRYEMLASADQEKFADSEGEVLSTYYPHLVDRIVQRTDLAERVKAVHLAVSDFRLAEYNGRDFSSLALLPNLTSVECTYSANLAAFVPTLNKISGLNELQLYYCDPIPKTLQELDNSSLREVRIHMYTSVNMPNEVLLDFSQRMPECAIIFTTD